MHFQRNSTKECFGAETGPCRVCPRDLTPQRSLGGVGKEMKHHLTSIPNPTLPSPRSCCATLCSPPCSISRWFAAELWDMNQCPVVPLHKLLQNAKAATIISNQTRWQVTDCSKNHHYGTSTRHESLFCLQLTPAHLCFQVIYFLILYFVPTQFPCNMTVTLAHGLYVTSCHL